MAAPTLSEIHAKQLALIEGQRLCDIKTAAKYLGRSYQHVHQKLKEQRIRSVYDDGRRMVVVADLIRYVDKLPIDPPEPE